MNFSEFQQIFVKQTHFQGHLRVQGLLAEHGAKEGGALQMIQNQLLGTVKQEEKAKTQLKRRQKPKDY